jgi:NADH dehydrogenase [ubiquinone] 1 alpha subcomplex assembly factor 7
MADPANPLMERLDAFMARANAAYYAAHDPFRDFTTSPEISQVFGEILGLWAAVVWQQIGQPDPFLLVEAGPGRGTLMADALRAIGQVAPAFGRSVHVHLIETSPRLRAEQAKRIADPTWHEGLETVPEGPFVLLANEFLDALPIRQIIRRGDEWKERFVQQGQFVEMPTDARPHARPSGYGSGRGGALIYELNEPAATFMRAVGDRLSRHPGAALFLDYGPEHSAPGDSLQALRDGKPAEPIADPGVADLTAHVDFEALADAVRDTGAAIHGPIPQGLFLIRLGLFRRTDRLARSQPPKRAAALIEAARRLAEADRMGRLFKAMALGVPGQPVPPGFE